MKQFSRLTTDELKEQMSIAGDPDKIIAMMKQMEKFMGDTIDQTNVADLINTEMALKFLSATIKRMIRNIEKRTGQKYV